MFSYCKCFRIFIIIIIIIVIISHIQPLTLSTLRRGRMKLDVPTSLGLCHSFTLIHINDEADDDIIVIINIVIIITIVITIMKAIPRQARDSSSLCSLVGNRKL